MNNGIIIFIIFLILVLIITITAIIDKKQCNKKVILLMKSVINENGNLNKFGGKEKGKKLITKFDISNNYNGKNMNYNGKNMNYNGKNMNFYHKIKSILKIPNSLKHNTMEKITTSNNLNTLNTLNNLNKKSTLPKLNTLNINKELLPKLKKHWTEYDTWEKLKKNDADRANYIEDRNLVINNPNLDWSLVLHEMLPKLSELREYIGLINLGKDKKTMKLVSYEASPSIAGEDQSETTFASIPSSLVEKFSNKPALFMFHTHPSDPRGCPLPSSHDLSTALYFAATARFAASVIISKYGIFMYGLSHQGYNSVVKSKDWNLAILNLSFDIVSAHESIRSWGKWKLSDYMNFYKQYRMFMYVFPSSEYVGDYEKNEMQWHLETPISYDLIMEHYEDIQEYLKNTKYNKKYSIFSDKLVRHDHIDIGLD